MRRRCVIRVFSYLLALLIVIGVGLILTYQKQAEYKDRLKYTYSRSFEILGSSLNNITVNLQKANYATTPLQFSEISAKIFSETVIAKQALAEFPTEGRQFDTVNKFLSQAGNYIMSLSRSLISGQSLREEDNDNLKKLLEVSVSIGDAVSKMQNEYNNSGYWESEIGDTLGGESTLADDFLNLEETLTDYPTLLYDGPFSEHKVTGEAEMLKNASEVTENAARDKINEMFGERELTFKEVSAGEIPAYEFTFEGGYASVSLDGGYVLEFREYNADTTTAISYEQARSAAQKFLRKNAHANFHETYYYADNGVCVINFAATQGAVICYADLVKVGVDMSSGNIVFYEAGGFVANHKTRETTGAKYSFDEAKNIVSPNLKITNYATALIPSAGGEEKLCYEFTCEAEDNTEILVYINAETLQEEDIFILLKTDGGTLVK